MVPNGWKQARLDSLATVERGKFSARPRNDPKYFGGETPFVQTGDVATAQFHLDNHSQTLNSMGLTVSKVFEEGTILLTIAANIGATAITRRPTACPDSVVGIKPLSTVADLFWLKYSLANRQSDLDAQAGQNAQKNINLEVLKPLLIATPPLSEQRHIGKILFTWDQAIATAERLLANRIQQAEEFSNALLSGRKRFGNFGPWKPKPLSEVIRESRVVGSGGHVAKKLTVKLYGKGVVGKSEKRLGSESTQYYRRSAGQFIYSKLDFLNGAFGIVPDLLDGYESTLDLPAFDFLDGVDPRWFLQYVSREAFYVAHLGLANGGRKARRVNPADLLRVSIKAPCLAEQVRIADAIDHMQAVVNLHDRQLVLMREEKAALMSQLLTGKRRVKLPDVEAEVQS